MVRRPRWVLAAVAACSGGGESPTGTDGDPSPPEENRAPTAAGNREAIAGTATAGTLYVGLQAWKTPSGRIPYWLAIW